MYVGPKRLPSWWGAGLCIDPLSNKTFIGGGDSIPVPIWPKDVPLPSATEEWEKRQRAIEESKKKAAVDGKKRAVEAVKRMLERDVLSQGVTTNSQPLTTAGESSGSGIRQVPRIQAQSQPLSTTAAGAKKQAQRANVLPKLRPRSQRITKTKLAKKREGPGSTYDSALSLE